VRALDDAEASGLLVGPALSRFAATIGAAPDPVAELQVAVQSWDSGSGGRRQHPQELVAGLVPRATRIEDEDLARAVGEREAAIAKRAGELAEQAVFGRTDWARPFGPPPQDATVAETWWDRLALIAAYRERWHVTGPGILGEETSISSLKQAAHRHRARRAGQEAAVLAGMLPAPTARSQWAAVALGAAPEVEL
jgi:hypothetical protein